MGNSIFDDWNQLELAYGAVCGHMLKTSILWSKSKTPLLEQKLPVLVFWHGGGFVTGHRMYEPWWPKWLLDFALSQNAMVLAPDYRLLPEASGADILEDMNCFWTWFGSTFAGSAELKDCGVQPDISRVVTAGQSAGGSIAVHSALHRPDVNIKAVIAISAALELAPELKMTRARRILGASVPPPHKAEAAIRAYIKANKGNIRTAGELAEKWNLLLCILQQGWMPRLVHMKPDSRLDAVGVMEHKTSLPPMWCIHGRDDSVLPVTCTTIFAERMREVLPEVPVLLSVKPGDHCFEQSLSIDIPWISEGCQFVNRYW